MGVDKAAVPPVRRPPPPLPNRRNEPTSNDLWDKCRDKRCTFFLAMQADDVDVGPAYSPPRENAKSPFRCPSYLQT